MATPDNEAAWVEASKRMTVRQLEALVADREAGDLPYGMRDPVIEPRRLVFELPTVLATNQRTHTFKPDQRGDLNASDASM